LRRHCFFSNEVNGRDWAEVYPGKARATSFEIVLVIRQHTFFLHPADRSATVKAQMTGDPTMTPDGQENQPAPKELDQQENQPLSTAPAPFAGWKVVNPGKDYRWIKCVGCGGEVGIPSDWSASTVECPKCGLSVQVGGGILYRPPAPVQRPELFRRPDSDSSSPSPQPVRQSSGSLYLAGKAQATLILGVMSVVLGWTFIIPFIGCAQYLDTSTQAEKENVPVPGKATAGLILCLIFGIAQTIAVISHFVK
jgi:hypothetical protein